MIRIHSRIERWRAARCAPLARMCAAATLSIGLCICAVAGEPVRAAQVDEKAVGETVQGFLARLQAGERDALDRLVTSDFYAFDAGMRMNLRQLFSVIADARAGGRVFSWSVSSLQVRIATDSAFATWCNVGSITDSGGVQPQRWLESAALVRSGDGWRLAFLHSTRQAAGRGFAVDCEI